LIITKSNYILDSNEFYYWSPAFNPFWLDIASYNHLVYPPASAHQDAIYGPTPNSVKVVQLNLTDPTPLENLLAAGHPVAISTFLSQWKKTPAGYYDFQAGPPDPLTAHAVLLVGYDHNKKLFRIKNSWGTNWNGNGFADVTYQLVLSDNSDPCWISELRNPGQPVNAGVGALRGFWSAVINGVKGVAVIRHAYQSVGTLGVVNPNPHAGQFYGNDGSTLDLDWSGGEYNRAVFAVQNTVSVAKTIYLSGGPAEWSYVAMGANGQAVETGGWSRTKSPLASNPYPASYLATRDDPYLFANRSAACQDCGPFSAPATAHQPAISVRSTGEADVVAQGPNNSLVYYYAAPGGNWTATTISGAGTTFSTPSICVRSTGEADVVAQGPNNSLIYCWATPGANWSSVTMAAGLIFSAPSLYVRPNGEADIVAQGPNNSLQYYHAVPNGNWTGVTIAGNGTTFSAPAIFVRASGEADIVAQGAGNSLMYYHPTASGNWSGVFIAGALTTFSAPSIFVRSNGEADIVAQGPLNSLAYYHAMPNGPWSSATFAGSATTFGKPAIFVRANGEADVVAQGWNGSLHYYHATPGSQWNPAQIGQDGTALSAPSIFVRPNGEADLVTQGPDGLPVYYHALPNSGWSAAEL